MEAPKEIEEALVVIKICSGQGLAKKRDAASHVVLLPKCQHVIRLIILAAPVDFETICRCPSLRVNRTFEKSSIFQTRVSSVSFSRLSNEICGLCSGSECRIRREPGPGRGQHADSRFSKFLSLLYMDELRDVTH